MGAGPRREPRCCERDTDAAGGSGPGVAQDRRGGGGGAARPARRYEVAVQPGGQSAPGVGPAREEWEVRAAWVLAGGTPFLVVARGGRSGCETLREGACVK